jgi:hypothetical protein
MKIIKYITFKNCKVQAWQFLFRQLLACPGKLWCFVDPFHLATVLLFFDLQLLVIILVSLSLSYTNLVIYTSTSLDMPTIVEIRIAMLVLYSS